MERNTSRSFPYSVGFTFPNHSLECAVGRELQVGTSNGNQFEDDIVFSDYAGTVAAMIKVGDVWEYEVIANGINYQTGTIVNSDGSETLLTSFAPTPTDGSLETTIRNSTGHCIMHEMSTGDLNGDGIDDIVFSDYAGTVSLVDTLDISIM